MVIVPFYLAKGLEFDVVMLSNVDSQRYGMGELDIKLLYVAMTRPLIFCIFIVAGKFRRCQGRIIICSCNWDFQYN